MTRRAVVSVEHRGHEPGWLEPKETGGVETWLRPQVQQSRSGPHRAIVRITKICRELSMHKVLRRLYLTFFNPHNEPMLISYTVTKRQNQDSNPGLSESKLMLLMSTECSLNRRSQEEHSWER